MIVSCPTCHSRYRVREDKLPAAGGHIRCPGCKNIFIARPKTTKPAETHAPIESEPSGPRIKSGFDPSGPPSERSQSGLANPLSNLPQTSQGGFARERHQSTLPPLGTQPVISSPSRPSATPSPARQGSHWLEIPTEDGDPLSAGQRFSQRDPTGNQFVALRVPTGSQRVPGTQRTATGTHRVPGNQSIAGDARVPTDSHRIPEANRLFTGPLGPPRSTTGSHRVPGAPREAQPFNASHQVSTGTQRLPDAQPFNVERVPTGTQQAPQVRLFRAAEHVPTGTQQAPRARLFKAAERVPTGTQQAPLRGQGHIRLPGAETLPESVQSLSAQPNSIKTDEHPLSDLDSANWDLGGDSFDDLWPQTSNDSAHPVAVGVAHQQIDLSAFEGTQKAREADFEPTRRASLREVMEQGPRPSQALPATQRPEQWKLRSPVGLVYDFPDLRALRNWLGTKDSVDGMQASKDGGNSWQTLHDFPELKDALPKYRRTQAILTAPPESSKRSDEAPSTRVLTRPKSLPSGLEATNLSHGQPAKPTDSEAAPTMMLSIPERQSSAPYQALTAQPTPAANQQGIEPGRTPQSSSERQSVPPSNFSAAPNTLAERPRPTTRPFSSVATGHHIAIARRRRQTQSSTASSLTILGTILTLLVLSLGAVQISGVFDLMGALGMRRETTTSHSPVSSEQLATPPEQLASPSHQIVSGPTVEHDPRPIDPGHAREHYRQTHVAGEIDSPASPRINPHQATIDNLVRQAHIAAGEGRNEEAIQHLTTATQLDRTNAQLFCLLAQLYREAGLYAQADSYEMQCNSLLARSNTQSH